LELKVRLLDRQSMLWISAQGFGSTYYSRTLDYVTFWKCQAHYGR